MARINWVATALALCALYLSIFLAPPSESYDTLLEAQRTTGEPFGNSSSPFVADVGKVVTFLDAVKMYAASQTAHSLGITYPPAACCSTHQPSSAWSTR